MFFTFLNKDEPRFPDISLISGYYPDEVLTYFYNSQMFISLSTFLEMKEIAANNTDAGAPIREWEVFFSEIELESDLDNFINNDYLHTIGPYYYPMTNTCIYLTKEIPSTDEIFNAEDLSTLRSLEQIPEQNPELYTYYKSRKNNKKPARNESELIKDIDMCLLALKEVEKLNRHINFLNKYLEKRYNLVQQEELKPMEPDNIPEKPVKEEEIIPNKTNLIPFSRIVSRKKKSSEKEPESRYNYEMKVYIIRYREYEKACDRYKNVLENWSRYRENLMKNCFRDIEIAEQKLKSCQKCLKVYNTILAKSYVHSNYQDIQTLKTFRKYLETGRAQNLQECMNLFEEECHWLEIKASQERIENTIYFLQGANDNYRFASNNIDRIIKNTQEKVQGT